jgi:hypothetical protein
MGEGAQQWRAQAERRQHAQEENDVASGPQEDRGSTTSAVGESEGCAEKSAQERTLVRDGNIVGVAFA